MPNAFETLMQEARDAGVDPQWIDRVEQASAGSPLRKEKDQLAEQLRDATEQANRYRGAALASQFTSLGIKVKPDALNIPTDLDPLDEAKVREWAVGAGLAEPPDPTIPQAEFDAHQRVEEVTRGPGDPPRPNPADGLDPRRMSEDEFYAKAREAGVRIAQP